MSEITLGRLQNKVTTLENKVSDLQELLTVRREKYQHLKKSYDYLEKTLETKIEKAVNNATIELQKENEKLKEELEKMKKLLHADSSNSGIPTSKTPIGKEKRIPNLREKSDKKIGGQKGHEKHKLEKFRDEVLTDEFYYSIKHCTCGGKLKKIGERTKDELEIEVRVQNIRHHFEEFICTVCGKELKTPIPKRLKEENQYGSKVQALAVSLINEGCVSFNRTRKLINGFSNAEIDMSEGFLVKLQKKCSDKLDDFIDELKRKIINEKVINWDDTVIAIDKKQGCLRFYGTDKLALYFAHEKKDKKGLDEDNILNNLTEKTTVIHDHNTVNYNEQYEFDNAECCVHLLRDLKKIDDNLNRNWSKRLSELLVDTNKRRKEYMDTGKFHFEDCFIDDVLEKYDSIIKEASEINKKDFNKYYGCEEKTLINRLIKYKNNYLMWITRFDIDFSNNLAERSLRGSKTKMKVSGQFKNISNAEYYSRIKSYIETCKRNGINEHEAIVKLLNDEPLSLNDMIKTPNL